MAKRKEESMSRIKLRNGDTNHPDFQEGIKLISEHTGFKGKMLFDIAKLQKKVHSRANYIENAYNKIVKKHVEYTPQMKFDPKTKQQIPVRDPKTGKVVTIPKSILNQHTKQPEFAYKDKAGFEQDFKEIMDIEFEVNCPMFKTTDFDQVNLAPKHFMVMHRLFEDIGNDDFEDENIEVEPITELDGSIATEIFMPKDKEIKTAPKDIEIVKG